MDPATAGAIATLGAGAIGFLGGENANRANAQEARRNRAFQADQSATAYQRAAVDLRKAGLNPILAAGAQASTPSGSMAHMEDSLSKGVSSAIETRRLYKELQAVQSQADLNKATEGAQNAAAEAAKNSSKKMAAETQLINSQQKATAAEARAREKKAAYDEKLAPLDAINSRIQNGLGTVNRAMDIFNPTRYIPNWKTEKEYNRNTGEIETYRRKEK